MLSTVLVIGANRGLGLHFALQHLGKGFNVYGTFRKESTDEAKEVSTCVLSSVCGAFL